MDRPGCVRDHRPGDAGDQRRDEQQPGGCGEVSHAHFPPPFAVAVTQIAYTEYCRPAEPRIVAVQPPPLSVGRLAVGWVSVCAATPPPIASLPFEQSASPVPAPLPSVVKLALTRSYPDAASDPGEPCG